MKKALFVTIVLLSIIGCNDSYETDIIIRECVTPTGDLLPVSVAISINGEMKTWEPGSPVSFSSDIGADIGFVEVTATADGYASLSPELYEIDVDQGLELILMFTQDDQGSSIAGTNTISTQGETDIEVETDKPDSDSDVTVATPTPQGTVAIQSVPSEITLFVRKVGEDGLETYQISQSSQLTLSVGDYQWTAQSEGYLRKNGGFSITENELTEQTVVLEEVITEGTLQTITVPENAVIEVTDLETREMIPLGSGEMASFKPGRYGYRIFLDGYNPIESQTIVNSGEMTRIVEELSAVSVDQLIEQIRNISSLRSAINLYDNLPETLPVLTISQRTDIVDGLYNLAQILNESNERDRAGNLLKRIIDINPRHIQSRWLYAEILTIQEDYDLARSVLLPALGAYTNDFNEPQRSEIRLRTRYRYADTFYKRYRSLDASNINERERTGDRTLAAYNDFIERYYNQGEPQNFSEEYELAKIIIRDISADLGR